MSRKRIPRVLLLGATGQLGTELLKAFPSMAPSPCVTCLSRSQVDLADPTSLRAAVQAAEPDYIVNAAAYTAVDRAESEPESAHAINTLAPTILAEEAGRRGAWLVHFSTDYVFDGSGNTPWCETDYPAPLNAYGRSKLEGEQGIAATGCRHIVLRTSWVYASHGNNFLRTMLRLGKERSRLTVVSDQIGAPTSAKELARATRAILTRLEDSDQPTPQSGIYHVACSGQTSWFGFAQAIFGGFAGTVPIPEIVPIVSAQYPTPAARPKNSLLACGKLELAFGIRLAPWQDALSEVLAEIKSADQA